MITIEIERPDTPEASSLIAELDAILIGPYPPEANYCLSVEQLLDPRIAFFVAREDGEAVGCGALRIIDDYAEVKRMYVRPGHRGKGIAKSLLNTLEALTLERGLHCLRLETGNLQTEAICLYVAYGFEPIGEFGEYQATPHNLFYEKTL